MDNLSEFVELLFFDTFAHDNSEEINLDLVQFPKPVYVTEVRIIPLGARVQADFPGGVRLGATNPSQFKIEFFVNDLGKPGASTFESLGGFEYNQNGCINLECTASDMHRKIHTDGLVLKGWYTTITLAVYGTLTMNISEPIVPPIVNPSLPSQSNSLADPSQIVTQNTLENEWPTGENIQVPMEYQQSTTQAYQQPYPATSQTEPYGQEYQEFYTDVPKDPRSYHHGSQENPEWDKVRVRSSDLERDKDRDRRDIIYPQKQSNERDHRNDERRDRDRDKYHDSRDWDRIERDRLRERDRDRDRDRSYKHEDSCRRSSYTRSERGEERDSRDDRKRSRCSPLQSPKRPRTPHDVLEPASVKETSSSALKEEKDQQNKQEKETVENINLMKNSETEIKEAASAEDVPQIDAEEFEPILSDEDIVDDNDQFDVDYDYNFSTANDDLIKLFVPGCKDLIKYEQLEVPKFGENGLLLDENFKTVIGIIDDYFKSSITKYVYEDFEKLNSEIKEEFIHLCEKLISTIGSAENLSEIVKMYKYLQDKNMTFQNDADKEIFLQINNIVESTLEWLKIALNYNMANSQDQPAYKIRHIKCGIRLAQFCCEIKEYVNLMLSHNFYIYKILMDIYQQEYMALSIKLSILKALDNFLSHPNAMELFLKDNGIVKEENGHGDSISKNYQTLINFMRLNPSVRLKFALSSILRKINLQEIFYKINLLLDVKTENNLTVEHIDFVAKSLYQILENLKGEQFVLSQPKRFLPVSSQFEINREKTKNVIIEFFKNFQFMQVLVLLLNHPITFNIFTIKSPIMEIINHLLDTEEGLKYLSENCDLVNILVKNLLQSEEDVQYLLQNGINIKLHNLGMKIAYKIQCYYHVSYLLDIGVKRNYDYSNNEIVDALHALYCLTLNPIGKKSVAEVLSITNNFKSLIQFINTREKLENHIAKIKKSPSILYILDLILIVTMNDSNVDVMLKYWKEISYLLNLQECLDDVGVQKLSELKMYLIPFENSIAYDNISPLVDLMNRDMETFIQNCGTVVSCLRIIYKLGVSTSKTTGFVENPFNNYLELKYKHVILQLFSLDGTSTITKILQKLCDYYDQPNLHTSNFMAYPGLTLINIIYPCVELLKQMLTYVIQCRNTHFKDLTAIPTLLCTYNLMCSFPVNSPYYFDSSKIRQCIVDILLVYTQPISEEVHENDSLTKTVWSLMCGEIIKYITLAPYTFLSGLSILSELLPLPLPVQTCNNLNEKETSWVVNLRKLWSAHLHPHNNTIQYFVTQMCTTSNPQTLNLLRRICVQISDLAANSALMIARGVMDALYEEIAPKDDTKEINCTPHLARLLHFLACLVTHNTIKCAILHLLHTNSTVSTSLKIEDRYFSLFSLLMKVTKKNNNKINSHIQSQECILSIIQSLCDAEISLLQNSTLDVNETSSNVYLANALPSKEQLINFIFGITEHLTANDSFVTCLPAVRTLLLLTEHDFGFFNLHEILVKKNSLFVPVLHKLADNFSKNNDECISLCNTSVEFFYALVATEEVVGPILYLPRTMKFHLNELKALIGWDVDDNNENHPLYLLKTLLKEVASEHNSFETLLEKMLSLINILNNTDPNADEPAITEPLLPSPEPLLVQFSERVLYTSNDICNERLTTNYWLSVPNDEPEAELEKVNCDLVDISKQYLSVEFNLVREIEKLCQISSTHPHNEKEKKPNDHISKVKRPFVTPSRTRGFARTPQQRPDLFRSRPPNTSRPPSLHVDDFVALETCGAQPTGPTGYNKISREFLACSRNIRGTRGRAFLSSERASYSRQMSWWGVGFGRLPY